MFFGGIGFPSFVVSPIILSNMKNIKIGRRVRVLHNSRMEVLDNQSRIVIQDNVTIGQGFHIICGGGCELVIGADTTISANVFISNISHEYKEVGVHIMNQSLVSESTSIGRNSFIGYGSVIQAGTVLGKHCVVGANSVVRGHFPDYSVIVGSPARVIKRYNDETKTWLKVAYEER